MPTLPDFLIVGGQKCGTTAAARNLSLHPQVDVFRGVTKAGQRNEIEFFNQHWDKGVSWYASHFEASNALLGEKTAELFHRTICHERMFRTNPAFKIIVILRAPWDRSYSQWRMAALHKGDEPEDFEAVIAREMDTIGDGPVREAFYRADKTGVSCWREGYLLKGMYAEQLESLYRWFPREQVCVAVTERIRRDMALEYGKVLRFLGLVPLQGDYGEHFVGRSAPPMSSATKAKLVDLYRGPNAKLFELLGQEIAEWR